LVDLLGGDVVLQPQVGWEVVVVEMEVASFGVGGLVDYFGVVVGLVVEDRNGVQVVA
jgi:hypothetical protein